MPLFSATDKQIIAPRAGFAFQSPSRLHIPGAAGITGPLDSILDVSPLSYYTLDDTNDDDGSRDSVLLSGTGTEFAVPPLDPNAFNSSLRFNSTLAYRRSTFTDGSVPATFTIGMFIWIDSFVADTRYISLAAQGTSGASNTSRSFVLQAHDVNTDGVPVPRLVIYSGSGAKVMLGTDGISTDAWHYLEFRHTSGAYSLTIDDSTESDTVSSGSVNSGSNQLFIGRPSGDATERTSEINMAHFYLRSGTNTAQERLNIYREGFGLPPVIL